MKIVTICGSMKFEKEMKKIAFVLETKHDMSVLQCVYNESKLDLCENDINALSLAHYRKIEIADAIYVVNINGYIGEQVKKEIAYAQKLGKEVIFHTEFVEVEAVVEFIKSGGTVEYSNEIIEEIEKAMPVPKGEKNGDNSSDVPVGDSDADIIDRAVDVLCDAGQASVSYLQRKLKLGYARAARIMDQLEELGVVGPYEGSKPRSVLVTKEMWAQRRLINEDTIAPSEPSTGSEYFDEAMAKAEDNS